MEKKHHYLPSYLLTIRENNSKKGCNKVTVQYKHYEQSSVEFKNKETLLWEDFMKQGSYFKNGQVIKPRLLGNLEFQHTRPDSSG